MRDDTYRNHCLFPHEYDSVFFYLAKKHYKHGLDAGLFPDEYVRKADARAATLIHTCIRKVLSGEEVSHHTLGQCIAIRANQNPNSPDYQKVILAIRL